MGIYGDQWRFKQQKWGYYDINRKYPLIISHSELENPHLKKGKSTISMSHVQ